jgi:flagellar basal-body rod modification protein FlgD
MSSVNSIFGSSSSTAQNGGQLSGGSNATITPSDFYKLIAAQLSNQDPDSATDTNQMVQSMMSISNYQSVQTQTTAINSLAENSTASNLLGKSVEISVPATASANSQTVDGTVTAANFYSNGATVTVNGTEYSMGYITKIAPAAAAATGDGSGN